MANQQMKLKLKAPKGRPLAKYVEEMDGDVLPKTVRAPDRLWERVEKLAEKHGESLNLICVLALKKVCDEEGV
jgi:hypothetical protein